MTMRNAQDQPKQRSFPKYQSHQDCSDVELLKCLHKLLRRNVKKAIILLILPIILSASCSIKDSLRLTAMTASDADSAQNESVVRLGVEQELVTIGLQTHIIGTHGEDQFYGVFFTADVNAPDMAAIGRPYWGYQAGLPTEDEDGGFHGPIFGTRYQLTARVETVVEGWYRSFNGPLKDADYVDQWKALAGIRIKF
jgi:hypothetical protein